MKLPPFELERYLAQYEFSAPHLLCCSDCESISVAELLALEPGAQERLLNMKLGYAEAPGDPALRESIARQYAGLAADDVLVHVGAQEAIFNAMNVLLEPGDHCVVHGPGYQSLAEVPRAIGAEVSIWRGTEAGGWELDLDDLKKMLKPRTKLVVLNCPHNPTGYLMGRDKFAALMEMSREHGFRVFSDEVYRFLELDHRDRLPAACEVDDRAISLGVTSKAYGLAGLRIGWLVTKDRELLNRLAAYKDYTTICAAGPSELLTRVALDHRTGILKTNLGIIRENLTLLSAFFQRHADRFSWRPPRAGPIAFPRLLNGDVNLYSSVLVEKFGVLLLPGRVYGEDGPHFRIGFGRTTLAAALERWEEAIGSGFLP